jgi:DNA topoisomerase-1
MKNRDLTYKLLTIQFGGKRKWETLLHSGVLFPPEYVPHNMAIKYKGTYIELSKEAEEYAMLYVKYFDSEYINNKSFNKNFWKDWKLFLNKENATSLEDFDFTEYRNKYLDLKQCKNNKEKTQEEKDDEKKKDEKYKIALINGKEEEVGNFRIEPPGLFIGRGDNPNIGKIKRRLYPEDVIINIGKNTPAPETLEGHKWGEIIHNRDVEWIASWKDYVTGKNKYVWLSHSSEFKAHNDFNKFELARKLKKKIKKINEINTSNLQNDNIKIKQLATALYLIDKLAIRVGNEKSSDEADTVGVTTLRVEHIGLEENKLVLDFLGKDSVPYHNSMIVDDLIRDNIKKFMEGKDKFEQLFDKISSTDMNNYLQTFMKDLTAKMFRSYNASHLFQRELNKIEKKYCGQNPDLNTIMSEYNKANIKVAKLLNHQKNVGKSHKTQVEKISQQIKSLKNKLRAEKSKEKKNNKKIKNIKANIKKLREKKSSKEETKNIALGTSRENYIDPRITISFMKKYNVPVEKIFSVKLQKKFKWAFDVDENYKF